MDSNATLWSILLREPGLGVMVLDAAGAIREANASARALLFADTDARVATLADGLPSALAGEWINLAADVTAAGAPIAYRFLRCGAQLQATVWPWAHAAGAGVLALVRPGQVDPGPGFELRESAFVDLGPLDVLTPRELEVLALIGQGCSTAAMAERMDRSPRTIEKHRDAVAAKLRARTRIELARIASRAGLEPGHARLNRTRR